MLVKTNRCFYDLREDCYRNVGDIFEVSQDRFEELNELVNGFVEEVKEMEEDTPEDKEVKTPEDKEVNEEVETEIQEAEEENKEDLTVAEIKEKLDEAGIEYKAKATKSELLELLK